MKASIPFVAITLFGALTAYLSAAEPPNNIGTGPQDKLRVMSPDGKEELWNDGDIFVINPPGVDGVFSSREISELDPSVPHNALYAVWSPDSRMVAVCVKTGRFTEDTFALIKNGQNEWRYLTLPYTDEDAWALPLRWLDSNTLVIQISGPREDKAEELQAQSFYIYTLTFRYAPKSDRFVKVSASKKDYPARDAN